MSEIAMTDAQILAHWATMAAQLNSITHDMAGLFVEWARLGGRKEEAIRAHFPTWGVTHRLLEAAARYADERVDVLKGLLDQSDARLYPLRDPLRMTFNLHRWMADDREEAYSDWLAWIFTELASPEKIGRVLFGDSIPEQFGHVKEPCLVKREMLVPEGNKGHAGRLDCVLQFSREAVIVIEVKLTNADATDTAKQEGYSRWLKCQHTYFKKALLLATDGKEEEYQTFTLLRWRDVCQHLRQLLPELYSEREIITAALIAGFVGAVEQNLLGVPSLTWIDKYRNDSRSLALQFLDRIDAATEHLQLLLPKGSIQMNDVDPKMELFREGLKSYLDVKQAVKAFEDLIGEVAKKVVSAHLGELTPIIALRDQNIYPGPFDPKPSCVAVGALVVAQEGGIRCGIRWEPLEGGKPGGLMACVSVSPYAPRARDKQNNLHRALVLHHQDSTGVQVEVAPPGQREVHVAVPLQGDVTLEQFEERLDMAFTTFLNLTAKAGGLQAAMGDETSMS